MTTRNSNSRKENPVRLLRTSEVMDRLNVSRSTLWRWQRSGVIPPRRRLSPSVVGWLEGELNEWLETRERIGGPPEDDEEVKP